MKVLLTGGSGNLGQTLVPRLIDRGDTPVILDVRPPRSLLNGRAVFIEGSVLDRPMLTAIFRGCDCIVHIAAWHGIHEDRGEKDAYDFFDLNVRGTFEVFEAAASAGIGKVILISTTSVYTPFERSYTASARVYCVLGSCSVRQIQRLGALVLERCRAYR